MFLRGPLPLSVEKDVEKNSQDLVKKDNSLSSEKPVHGAFDRLLTKKMGPEEEQEKFKVTIRDYLEHPLQFRPSSPKFSNSVEMSKLTPSKTRRAIAVTPLEKQTIEESIREAAEKYQVPQGLVRSIIRVESGFNPKAVSRAGAMGLMQLMPGTARELKVKNPFDIRENIHAGIRYLRKMLDRFGQKKELALAAYNAGQGNVVRYGGVPPYRETKNYIAKVMRYYEQEEGKRSIG